uniref:Uncharacterized protein n=2 Tax=Nothobranchius pienaari TaxID=704102 RepID=A0A1A8MUY1_9TELE
MLMLFVTVFGLSWGFSSGNLLSATACYGKSVELPSYPFTTSKGPLYFFPSDRSLGRMVMDEGKPKDPRITYLRSRFHLTNLTKEDDGYFSTRQDGLWFSRVFRLEISDCAEKFYRGYMDKLVYNIPSVAHFMEFTPELDSRHKPVILWNRTAFESHDKRRGTVKSNTWNISQLTQADNGYYIFRQNDTKLESIVHLTVKEKTLDYERNTGQTLFIPYPTSGRTWTVVFKPEMTNIPEKMLKDGQVVGTNNRFSGRLKAQDEGLEIDFLESKDSGSFEFRDLKGNLALIVEVEVNRSESPNHAVIAYAAMIVGALLAGICCCCCCKKCCCKKGSAPQTEAAPAVTYHDKTPGTATSPPVYYHNVNPPTGPDCPAATNPSVFPHQPPYQPVTIYPTQPGISVYPPPLGLNPPQPGISVNPPPSGLNPPQPGISVNPPPSGLNPPQPGISMYPPQPGTNVNPLQPEVSLPTDQGSAAFPTFNLEFLSSDPDTRFELKGPNAPSAPPLSSETSSSDVYNSEKLNFL